MPNLIYNIPTDQSSFLTRSTYAANPSVYAAFYATVLGATSSSDVKKIKYVVHVVDSKGMAMSNSNIEFSMAKVKETLLLIGVKLEPVAVDLADAPLDNAYGIVRNNFIASAKSFILGYFKVLKHIFYKQPVRVRYGWGELCSVSFQRFKPSCSINSR